ncbi:MAG TPA: hypothetical protein VGI93_20900 [Steroidobacteraceae bacterium]
MITGQALTGGAEGQAWAYTADQVSGAYNWLGVIGGLYSTGYAINASGFVAGTSSVADYPNTNTHAFLNDATGIHDLGTLGGSNSSGAGLNAASEVVGSSTLPGDTVNHAFLYASGTMMDLNALVKSSPLAPYVTLNSASGINDNGWIVANGVDSRTGNTHGYLLQLVTSASGTSIPAATLITDASENVWTLSNGQVFENGQSTPSSSVVLVLYLNGNIYQKNVHQNWYVWNLTTKSWAATANPLVTSSSGTTIPAASYLVDGDGELWTLSAGQAYENGLVTQSSSVTLLLYMGGSVYQENVHKTWYRWNPTSRTWVASSDPNKASLSGTTVPPATELVDAGGNLWAISGGQAYENGQVTPSGGIILLLCFDGVVYQENAQKNWWQWNSNTAAWLSSSDPRQSSPSGTTLPTAMQIVDSGHNVWTASNGQAFENGLPTPSSSVTLLLYANGVLYQENVHKNWYAWRNGGWIATAAITPPSVDGTTIPAGTQIIDNELNTWTLSNGQVFENHALTLSSSVTLVLFYGGSVYQENVHNAWYRWNGGAWVAVSADPRGY